MIRWTIYVSDGTEVLEPGATAVIIVRDDVDNDVIDGTWWVGPTRQIGPDEDAWVVQADQVSAAMDLVARAVGAGPRDLRWRPVTDPGSWPYSWALTTTTH